MVASLKRIFGFLAKYLRPQWRMAVLMAFLLFTNIGLELFNPQVLKYFIDAFSRGKVPFSTLLLVGVAFICIALVNQAVAIAASYLSVNVAWTATNQLRHDLMEHCLALDIGFYKERTVGELIERIDGDVDLLAKFFSEFVVYLVGNVLLLLSILILFFIIDWRVGIATIALSLAIFWTLIYLRKKAIPAWGEQRQQSATFYGMLSEWLLGTEDISTSGSKSYIMQCFTLSQHIWFPVYRKAELTSTNMSVFALFTSWCASALALALGAYLWGLGLATIGTIYLIYTYTNLLSYPIEQIQTQIQDLQQAEACILRVSELLHTQSALPEEDGAPIPQGALEIAFQHVTFGYTTDEPVLKDLTFQVQAGKVTGVLGRTGSGKSTLARLLFRLYDPQRGEIRVGDVPIRKGSLRAVRQRIGMVTQDVQIFQATVRDNLTFFNQMIPDERIHEVLTLVGLTSWYQRLSHGLDTILKGKNGGLSAGEAQLLAFARIFLSNPGVIILDEASSRLDPATENLIERALDTLFIGRTVIIIAHRLTTIQRADEIIILDQGEIIESGQREALMQMPSSHFSRLLLTAQEGAIA